MTWTTRYTDCGCPSCNKRRSAASVACARTYYAQLARVYQLARLHVNFFQPVEKLVTKTRQGARVHLALIETQWTVRPVGAAGALRVIPANCSAPRSHVPSDPRTTPSMSVLYGAASVKPADVPAVRRKSRPVMFTKGFPTAVLAFVPAVGLAMK